MTGAGGTEPSSRRPAAGARGVLAAAALTLLLAANAACRAAPRLEADVILRGGPVMVMGRAGGDAQAPAAALAIREGRILAAGPEEAVLRHKGARTRIVDLSGAAVVPGFGLALTRPYERGERILNEASGGALFLDLTHAESEEDVVQRVRGRARAAGPGEWILGAGWDETRWVVARPPDKRLISDIVAYNPVLLARAGGGVVWVNAKALDLAGLDGRGADATGLLNGRACDPVLRRVPRLTSEERGAAIVAGLQDAAAGGVTMVSAVASSGRLGIGDPSAPAADVLGPWRDLALKGRLPVRVSLLVPAPSVAAEALVTGGPEPGIGGGWLDISTILLDASAPAPAEAIAAWAGRAAARGLGVAVLARGPGAVRAALGAFAAARAAAPGGSARLVLQLPQPLDASDLGDLASAGAVLTVQAAPEAGPEDPSLAATRGAGIDLAAAGDGDDLPALSALPAPAGLLPGFARRLAGAESDAGARAGRPDFEALRLFTLGPARAAGRAGEIGCLEPGCRADFVILSRDPIGAPSAGGDIELRVLSTWTDGREIFRAPGAAFDRPRTGP